jgi:putative tricarboxylic transport membrane protein
MEIFSGLLQGFAVSLTWTNIMFCFIGVTIGTLIGVLPGIGPVATLSLIIPTTFSMSPVSAIILLAGVYYGASYGGSTTAILINVPGEVGAMMTCIDGYQMARKGRAGAALGISAIGSFVGGTLGTLGLVFRAVPLSKMALRIGPPEYFGLMCMALMLVIFLARGSMLKAISMALVGILLTSIGIHVATGQPRFTMDITELLDGVGLVPMIMGLYGISEVILNLEEGVEQEIFVKTKVKGLLPNQEEWRRSAMPILRGTFIGFLVGIFPGGGTVMSTIVSYAVEKKLHKHPEKFGTGMIEGVAGPETANNASTSGAFVPLFTLGIPSNVTMAIFLGDRKSVV